MLPPSILPSSNLSCAWLLACGKGMFLIFIRLAHNMQWLPEGWCPSVVVIDIDGTITDGKKHLSTEAVHSVRRLEEAGIPVVLATGNVRPVTYGLWRFLGLSAPMCCENGGVIWHPSGAPVLRAEADEAKEAAVWLAKHIEGWTLKASPPTAGEKVSGACFPMSH